MHFEASLPQETDPYRGIMARIPAKASHLLLICLLFFVAGCGGGGNSTFDPVSGTLSIEKVTSASSSGSVAVKLISPHGSGPGTGTITIAVSNPDLVTFATTSQTADSSGNAIFTYTTKEVQADTVVSFTVGVGALSLSNSITVQGVGVLSLAVTVPTSGNAYGSITASYAGGSKAAGRTITIAADNTAIAFDTTTQTADANGQAVFSYRAVTLTSDTTVKFTATTSAQLASQSKLVPATTTATAPPVVGNVQVNSVAFVSASPTSISLKGAGGAGRSETSIITFTVKDSTGQPMAGQTVDFTLDTSVGGLAVLPGSAVSDSTGTVKTIVNAGIVSTPVRVTATVHGTTISVKSDQLIVSTGLPDQNHLSLAVETYNPEAWDYDNEQVLVTAMLADHFGNPVPDGTAVYFSCYGGSIEPSATTKNGIATVKWRSQNPRPTGNHDANGVAGIATILVYAIGEESFTDLNGNGVADLGEFTVLPEAFLAKSWTLDATGYPVRNPQYDQFIDFNGDGIYNDNNDGKFHGVLQGAASSDAPRSLNVFLNRRIVMSGADAVISLDKSSIDANSNTPVTVTVTDGRGNIMPSGTTVALSSTANGTCAGLTFSPTSFTVLNSLTPVPFPTTASTTCLSGQKSNLIVTVKTPKGLITTNTFNNVVIK